MKRYLRKYLIGIGAVAIILIAIYFGRAYFPVNFKDLFAGVFFTQSISLEELQKKYTAAQQGGPTVKVLIVPGHEPDDGGTSFGGLIERDLNVTIADYLAIYLREKKGYEVMTARNTVGYNKDISAFLNANQKEIMAYVNRQKSIMNVLVANDLVDRTNGIFHNAARPEVAARLYGLNLFANNNGVDIVIHIHLNDYDRRSVSRAGRYDGFAVYIPEKQFSNAKASRKLGEFIASELSLTYPPSSMPQEQKGIVEDQELISVGAYNTLDAAGTLIEYAYIYEPWLEYNSVRDVVFQDLALKTANGIDNFLRAPATKEQTGRTAFLPHVFSLNVLYKTEGSRDILALQALLKNEGYYPPTGKDLHDCPISGIFGPCTRAALIKFQKDKQLTAELGTLGTETRRELDALSLKY